jgi:small conductance mechanosensitive channel
MQNIIGDKMHNIGRIMNEHGGNFIIGLGLLIAGLLLARQILKWMRQLLIMMGLKPDLAGTICSVFNVLIHVIIFVTAASIVGLNSANLFKFITVVALIIVAVILLFRPYIPSLPFNVNNTVKTGDLLGKIEATNFLNTRMRTFDGRTVWIPNRKIINDYLINYHYTPTRRIHLDMVIRYDQDLMRTKQVLESIMLADARVKASPRPVVYVTNLSPDGVSVGGRCWVDNLKYWRTRCELLEKIKLGFDAEGIAFAHPQRDINIAAPKEHQNNIDGHKPISESGFSYEEDME